MKVPLCILVLTHKQTTIQSAVLDECITSMHTSNAGELGVCFIQDHT